MTVQQFIKKHFPDANVGQFIKDLDELSWPQFFRKYGCETSEEKALAKRAMAVLEGEDNGELKRKVSSFQTALKDVDRVGKTKKKKGAVKHPTIKLNTKQTSYLKEVLHQRRIKKEASSAERVAEEPLLEAIMEEVDARARNGYYNSTYTLVGADGKTKADFIISNRFCVPQEDEAIEEIKEGLGDDVFEQVIETYQEVLLKEEVLASPKLQKQLMRLLGSSFKKFFNVRTCYRAVDNLKKVMYDIADGDEEVLENIRSLVPMAKPMIKSTGRE